ncbi:conserved hypothetical protein [Solidesulfovibrio fructosivorans JJ]]|uniref:DUF4019 domain-containing protein n=1 Tax=Solidesulfovibrio fructosivorans JJ] TaxID=596151 RepID=E1JRT0_SOLFR|nr:DUF4019 domain-containing protein [Solidesulfovibrio fructosivorans]EFL52699.1 conserved hypothetical protein [Solidesulfovibrio fructosivorans JJ]]
MKTRIASLLVLILLLGAAPLAAADATVTDAEKPAVTAAKAWLGLIDAGDYGKSWQEAAPFFQAAVTKENWIKALTAFRQPLGALASRSLARAESKTSLPGAPDGAYVVMAFDARFAKKKSAVETVTFARQADGTWRAVGYFIR